MIDLDAVTRLRHEMVDVSRQIFARGLTSATSGNTSARVPGHPEQVLIKASGKSFGDVGPEDFLLVDLEGNILAGEGKPSKEIRFHLGILKARPEVQAVVHGHSAYATAYVSAKGELPVVTAAAEAGLNKVGVVEYATPGSVELAEMIIKAFEDPTLKAVVLKRHGFVTVGNDIRHAFYLADVLEDNAKVAFLLSQLG
ncbi:class II aldolase/adducin family protein [Moorella sulfitireducens]|uniref:class II aldolase/adducin family protein n=1 Tax=Neomoorella sulfitireducens TaxID=2972948 RepID=UPI0021AC6660|nr:class II aldolase/adducin family protein [Moorella sulfitireducens]